jgi:hypothetical protein
MAVAAARGRLLSTASRALRHASSAVMRLAPRLSPISREAASVQPSSASRCAIQLRRTSSEWAAGTPAPSRTWARSSA